MPFTVRRCHFRPRRAAVWAALALLSLAASCMGCNPPPVVDLPASALDVKITVIDTTPSPGDGKVPVVVQFLSGGQLVQLASNATVACNGVPLAFSGVGYAARIPIVAPGGTYGIVHVRSGTSTAASVSVPQRPVIQNPAAGASVARSPSLTITYVAAGAAGVRGSAGDGTTGLGGDLQADTGTYSGFNVSALKAGPGTIGLTREFSIPLPGTGFGSASASYSSGAERPVTWN